MNITWKQGSSELWYNGIMIPCSCNVRNELNGLRGMHEITRTMPNGKPYMPRIFPIGTWKVGMPIPKYSAEMAPYFIPTNAFQVVPIWNTMLGSYTSMSDEMDKDEAYGLHFSEYKNTLGCIKIRNTVDLIELVHVIQDCFKRKDEVYVIVS